MYFLEPIVNMLKFATMFSNNEIIKRILRAKAMKQCFCVTENEFHESNS
jgi:hypothetical protein